MNKILWTGAVLFSMHSAYAQTLPSAVLMPNANLKADGMPAISQSVVDALAPYTEFRGYGFVDWHPRELAMLVRHREAGANTAQIYRLDKPGGPLLKLTDFADPVSSALFAPKDGRYFVYARDSGGNEATQIYRMDLATRKSTLLSSMDERSSMKWNQNGDRLLISSVPLDRTATGGKRDNIVTRLSLVDPLEPTTRSTFAELPGGGWLGYSFNGDDKRIAAVQYRTSSDAEVHLIDARTGAREKVLPRQNDPKAGFGEVTWSKDQQSLFLTTNIRGEFAELAKFDLARQEFKFITGHIPWDVESFSLSVDGHQLLAVINNNGRDEVRLFDAHSGAELSKPDIAVGAVSGVRWHEANTSAFAFSLNSPQSPGEVFSYDAITGQRQQWTSAYADASLDLAKFVSPELVEIKSFDGLSISGWLYLPDEAKFPGKRPVVIDFHGGPEAQSTVRFMGRWNYYLNEMGLALLFPNVRGSSGYGKNFQNLDNGFNRKDSVKDGGAFLSWVGTHPRLDAARVAVSGGSYGGYMSLAMAVDYSMQLRAAVDVVGISHFVTFLNNTESYRRDLRRVEYGDERDPAMREFQEKIAPLNNAAAIKVPLFVVQGKNDPRVPYTEAEQMVAAVRKNGQPVWYLLADNEGHGFARKVNSDYYFFASVEFFQSTLLK